ncbi:phenylacetate--CoA ligase family protein [Niabella hibiscisoli]|uniref:phenylacetate--CoA ligase family protein n=1 Tax=Niabella hibiscisoli TaxID=1825928 RepID=UPI001F0D7230|nr:AMP-binding protein [Niabella hibiscisoli]MCH5715150.1 AMP-binding protein [Niabella hibiscisoli]
MAHERVTIYFFSESVLHKDLPGKKLADLLVYLQTHSAYYQELFQVNGIQIQDIGSIDNLSLIPPTEKEHLQMRNKEFLCVAQNKIIEYTATSGTVGSPVTVALTENDLQRLAYNEYSSFACANGTSEDIYQLMLTLDRQFMAGMAYYSGIRKLGAGVVRVGPGVPSLQWETIERLKPTAIVAVPSFIIKLIQYAEDNGIDINASSVKKAVCIGENIRTEQLEPNILAQRITDKWNIQLFSTYASTEMQTAFTECEAGKGGHLNPELLIVELIDDNGQPVTNGEPGEVTITTLGVEGMPLLRYKTGDICRAYTEPCSCGRHTLRLSPVIGRKKQMIKYKGTTLFAPALFEIIHRIDAIKEYVVEVYSNEIGTDEVLLYLTAVNDLEETQNKIKAYLQARLRVTPHIKYIEPDVMQKMQFPDGVRKPVKFIDRRN